MDPESAPAPTQHSRYACETCARAKAKCMPDIGSSKCARCSRLNKECVVLPPKPRKKRAPNTTSTAQLEKKIENLVHLISSSQGPKPAVPAENHALPSCLSLLQNGNGPESSWVNDLGSQVKQFATPHSTAHQSLMQSCMKTPASTLTPGSTVGSNSPSGFEARLGSSDQLLKVFRDQFLIHIPFAVIAPEETSQNIESRRPWLYKAILTVACQEDRFRQTEMGRQFASEIGEAIVVRGDRSLDMFQALLVYNTWSHFSAPTNPQTQAIGLFQLCIGLAFDLNLTRPIHADEIEPRAILQEGSKKVSWGDRLSFKSPEKGQKHSAEERRALLYCFALTTTLSQCMKKLDGLRYTSYIEHCCDALLETNDLDSDRVLVATVRLRRVLESANQNLPNDPPNSDIPKAPVWMYVKSIRAELHNIMATLPSDLQNNSFLRVASQSSEVCLYDLCLQKYVFTNPLNLQRLDMLYACQVTTKMLLDTLAALPPSFFATLSTMSVTQLGHGLSTLFKLSMVEDIGWDLAQVRENADLRVYFNHFISVFGKAGAELDISMRGSCPESFPTLCSRSLAKIIGWYNSKLASDVQAAEMQEQTGGYIDEFTGGPGLNYLDDFDWQEFMGDFMQP